MPSKMAFILFQLIRNENTYNTYVTFSNALLFLSHGNLFFINIFLNDQFYHRFLEIFTNKKIINR